jgi:hypothetical protein
MTENITQNNQILSYLEEGNKINPMDALNMFGCFRLASRVHDLRSEGYPIETIREPGKKYAEYKMAEGGVKPSTILLKGENSD